ncbi:MAG TPA: AbrB/MazE/SpoVT family DNA-binding domain-containing protein [Candidatus Thermoplasmatota archaeon]|nr:AbrB/MazE/SpoVT family DNA-binding domain-containing protein [Candidatus Thermoplasmatota archaeon]
MAKAKGAAPNPGKAEDRRSAPRKVREALGWQDDGPAASAPRRVLEIEPRLVDQHYRVVLPREVQAALGLQPGSHVHFAVDGQGQVSLRRVRLTLE